MANNYTQFSFAVALPVEAIEWVIAEAQKRDNMPCDDDDFNPTGADFSRITLADGINVHISADENGNPDAVVDILKSALVKFDLDKAIAFSWADTCSKARLDEFGGGAVAFTRDRIKWMNTYDWMAAAIEEISED